MVLLGSSEEKYLVKPVEITIMTRSKLFGWSRGGVRWELGAMKQQSKVNVVVVVGRWYKMMTKTVQISTLSIYRFIEIFIEIRPCQLLSS